MALFVLMLPANIHAAVADVPFDGHAATPLWFRIPEQVLYLSVALLAATSDRDNPVLRRLTALRAGASARR